MSTMSTAVLAPPATWTVAPRASESLCQNPGVREEADLDVAAVRRVAGGDEVALRELYDRYGRIVYGMTYRLTGDAQLAEEATQDTFVTLWRRADNYDPERAKLTTWLFVVARNRAIELGRKRSRTAEPQADLDPGGESPDPADLVALGDEAQRLAEVMAELPETQLEIVRLAYFDGLTHAEIADRTGLPLGTVKGRIRLALERLRALLADQQLGVTG